MPYCKGPISGKFCHTIARLSGPGMKCVKMTEQKTTPEEDGNK